MTTGAVLDWLLGPHCPNGCGDRVYPRDATAHTCTTPRHRKTT